MIKRKELITIVAYATPLLALLAVCFWLTSLDFGDFRPENSTVTYVLWALSTCIVLGAVALGFLLFRNLLKLYIERRGNVVGSHLKTKLVIGVLTLSILPIAAHVVYSLELLNRNFDKWFSQPTIGVFQSAQSLIEATSAEMLTDLERGAQRAADAIAHGVTRDEESLKALLRDSGAHYLGISGNGEESTQAIANSVQVAPPVLLRLLEDSSAAEQSGIAEGWLYAAVSIRAAAAGSARLLVGRKIPASILQDQAFVEAQVTQWKQLEAARPVVWRSYVYTLALITIFTLFIAVWLAQFASRQITRPVKALLDATGELAGGHLDYRVQTAAIDELGSLVESFNSMGQALQAKTGQLERSNRDLARANAEIDERRQMIDAILESITPGVISVDENGKILKHNESARSFAGKRPLSSLDSVVEVLDEPQRSAFEHMFGSARRTGVATREFEVKRGGEPQHLSVTVSSLDSGQAESGFVVVFEDNTELVRAQRSEAWQEVARRLAHEIKNPLTPVALAAGRIEVQLDRYADAKTDAERAAIRDTLESLTHTIDREVRSLNTLVSSFSDVARFPTIRPRTNDVNAVVRDAVGVFDGRLPGIDLRLITDPEVAQAEIDPPAFKRAIVNLIDNAAEVLQESWVKEIVVTTQGRPDSDAVEVIVADSGPGISAENKERLFLPYFSTKNRGSGLGLPIVRSVVEEHAGTIRVEDNQPAGTRFVIELPAVAKEPVKLREAIV
ncbi:MAG: ATP-binding protein [Bryobacterales bacterium]|nr:ATP-binding protein [Bryobacterales bacterium]